MKSIDKATNINLNEMSLLGILSRIGNRHNIPNGFKTEEHNNSKVSKEKFTTAIFEIQQISFIVYVAKNKNLMLNLLIFSLKNAHVTITQEMMIVS